MNGNPLVLEAAECDSTGRCVVLRIGGQTPLCFTATPALLRELKAAVAACYACMVEPQASA